MEELFGVLEREAESVDVIETMELMAEPIEFAKLDEAGCCCWNVFTGTKRGVEVLLEVADPLELFLLLPPGDPGVAEIALLVGETSFLTAVVCMGFGEVDKVGLSDMCCVKAFPIITGDDDNGVDLITLMGVRVRMSLSC